MDNEAKAYWAQKRKEMMRRERRNRGYGGQPLSITSLIIGLMVLAWLITLIAPQMLYSIPSSLRFIVRLIFSLFFPGTLIGLAFSALFVWFIGGSIEASVKPWQYLLVFLGSGLIGSLVLLTSVGFATTLGPFGLAGAYVYQLSRWGGGQAAQWVLGLLLINVIFTGFQPTLWLAMALSFGTGLLLAKSLLR